MLSMEDFDLLEVDDVIEAPGLFPGLDVIEPIKLRCTVIGPAYKDFVVTYFGVTLGKWNCKKEASGLTWKV
jgi:hypothetical protein